MTNITYSDGRNVECCFCHAVLTTEDKIYTIETHDRSGWKEPKLIGDVCCHQHCLPQNYKVILDVACFTAEQKAYFASEEYKQEEAKQICPACHQRKYGNWRNCPVCAKALHAWEVKDDKRRRVEKRIMRDVARKET